MTLLADTRTPTPVAARARDHALTVLLRCWLRETGLRPRTSGPLPVPLPATGRRLVAEVSRVSPSGAHDVTGVRDEDGRPVDLARAAELLTAEAAAGTGLGTGHARDARARVVESGRRLASYCTARAVEPYPPGLPGWLRAEQGLLAGHPWHPMTKSRDELPDVEDVTYSPETRGRFPLQWFAASRDVLSHDGAGVHVPALLRRLAGPVAAGLPEDVVPVPAHPWQAARLTQRPAGAELVERGDLRPLGPGADPWWATSSLRTVASPAHPVMLKLSLALRVTNSRRENTRDELLLAARTARLAGAGLTRALTAAHPRFQLVLDPAWVGVDADAPVGLDTVIRQQPFTAQDRAACAGALVDARPDRGRPVAADLVRRLATATGASTAEAASHFYRRWCDVVARPLLWLHGSFGIGLEAHLQNVVVGLDGEGVPERAWYRDNQGWYAASSKVHLLEAMLPGVGDGVPLVFDDALVTERIGYYLGVNHLFGVAAALAEAGLADEADLLRVLVDVLRDHARGPEPSPVAELLLHAPTLRTKANLLTGVDGRDEVHAPVEAQSVYVDLPNPLPEVSR